GKPLQEAANDQRRTTNDDRANTPTPQHPTPNTQYPTPICALYRNNHNGTFTDVSHAAGLDVSLYGMGCAVGDYDNDGDDDLYVTDAFGKSRLFRNERVETGRAVFT